jgi:hypothetical protein
MILGLFKGVIKAIGTIFRLDGIIFRLDKYIDSINFSEKNFIVNLQYDSLSISYYILYRV